MTIGELAELCVEWSVVSCGLSPGDDGRIAANDAAPLTCPRTIDATGHRPQVSLDEGVTRTYSWYRDTVFDGDGVSAR